MNNLATLGSLGSHDGTVIMKQYAEPLAVGFGSGLNTGWILSSHPQGKRYPQNKFSLSVSIRTAVIQTPGSMQKYDASYLVTNGVADLVQHVRYNNEFKEPPTFTGSKESFTYLQSIAHPTGEPLYSFRLPGGSGSNQIPLVFLQAGLGLFYDTDVTIRYAPEMNLNFPIASELADVSEFGKISLMGLSVRHGLNQWLPWGYKYPFEISLQAAYSKMKTKRKVWNYASTDFITPISTWEKQIYDSNTSLDYQNVLTETNALTANLILGKKWGGKYIGLNVFAGGGVEYSTFTIRLTGNYPVITYQFDETTNTYKVVLNAISDPINLEMENPMQYRGFGGFRFYIGMLDFTGELTYSRFLMVNLGVSISFNS